VVGFAQLDPPYITTSYRALRQNGVLNIHPNYVISASRYTANDFVMSQQGLRGISLVTSTACSASSHAIGHALELLHTGIADIVLAGGFEPISELTFAGFSILRSVTQDKIRPFDKNRSGLVLGEGAGMLVLEPMPLSFSGGKGFYVGWDTCFCIPQQPRLVGKKKVCTSYKKNVFELNLMALRL